MRREVLKACFVAAAQMMSAVMTAQAADALGRVARNISKGEYSIDRVSTLATRFGVALDRRLVHGMTSRSLIKVWLRRPATPCTAPA